MSGKYGTKHNTYHDAHGTLVIDTSKFPDMEAWVKAAHAAGLTAGWYHNNCRCSDHCTSPVCFAGDVNATIALGFDSIKLGADSAAAVFRCPLPPPQAPRCCHCHQLAAADKVDTCVVAALLDGCGAEEDVELWAELFNHSLREMGGTGGGQPGIMIENCHNGQFRKGKAGHASSWPRRNGTSRVCIQPRQRFCPQQSTALPC